MSDRWGDGRDPDWFMAPCAPAYPDARSPAFVDGFYVLEAGRFREYCTWSRPEADFLLAVADAAHAAGCHLLAVWVLLDADSPGHWEPYEGVFKDGRLVGILPLEDRRPQVAYADLYWERSGR